MTEEQIEHMVERKFDRLDARYLTSTMTRSEYETECNKIWEWCDSAYSLMSQNN